MCIGIHTKEVRMPVLFIDLTPHKDNKQSTFDQKCTCSSCGVGDMGMMPFIFSFVDSSCMRVVCLHFLMNSCY